MLTDPGARADDRRMTSTTRFASEKSTVTVAPLSGSNARWQLIRTTVRTRNGVTTVEETVLGKYAARSVADRKAVEAAAACHGTVA